MREGSRMASKNSLIPRRFAQRSLEERTAVLEYVFISSTGKDGRAPPRLARK
jgi:hypothetical protein